MNINKTLFTGLILAGLVFVAGCPRKVKTTVFPGALGDNPATPVVRVLLSESEFSKIQISTDDGLEIRAGDNVVWQAACMLNNLTVSLDQGKWSVLLGQKQSLLKAGGIELVPGNGIIQLGDRKYRGKLFLIQRAGGKFIVVNHVDIDGYLAGVLPRELYGGWDINTYRALSAAGRTFAMYHMLTSGIGRDYDLGDSVASQVYGGYGVETAKSRQAVTDTQGVVMTALQNNQQRIFLAQYSSCCGGWENGAKILRDAPDIEPLKGTQRCTDCKTSTKFSWPVVRVTKQHIYKALTETCPQAKTLVDVKQIEGISYLDHGRMVNVKVSDSAGRNITMRAENIRLALLFSSVTPKPKLYSMNCRMVDLGDSIEFRDGRGFGHGVGLCQFGAEGKAKKGWTPRQILEFYYPGAQITKAY